MARLEELNFTEELVVMKLLILLHIFFSTSFNANLNLLISYYPENFIPVYP